MPTIKLTNTSDADFIALTKQLDDEYYEMYGEIALNYRQFNTHTDLLCVVIAYDQDNAVGCGSFKRHDETTAELKRVYVQKPHRRCGLAAQIVSTLEKQAQEQGFLRAVLETGADMKPARALYENLGYSYTDNFGPFSGDALCVCMEKALTGTKA